MVNATSFPGRGMTNSFCRFLFIAAGVVVLALGAADLLGWRPGKVATIGGDPAAAPIQPYAALGFLLLGVGFVSTVVGWRWAAALCGSAILVAGVQIDLGYVLDRDLGIESVLASPGWTAQAHPPDRMPPNAALCFALCGGLLLVRLRRTRFFSVVASILGASVGAIAFVASVGYVVDVESAYGWGGAPQMTLPMALGFLSVGFAVFIHSMFDSEGIKRGVSRWLPAPVIIGGATAAICVWWALAGLKDNLLKRIQALFGKESFVDGNLPEIALASGLVAVGLIAAAIYLAQKASQRAKERRQALVALQKTHRELKRTHAELERRVAARTAEISRVNEELHKEIATRKRLDRMVRERATEIAKADRRKDEFMAMLGHELRNPLAALSVGLETLAFEDSSDTVCAETRKTMKERLDYIVRLVDDLLDVSRVAHGKMRLQKRRVDFAAVVSRSIEGVRPLIRERGHDLSVALPPGPIFLQADDVRLEQVVSNLLSNAAKYTRRNGRIWVTVRREGGFVSLSVKDTGIGISKDVLPRIFDSFTQANRALEGCDRGLGVGLTLVHRLVALHGGTVGARSAGLGKGSEFIVRLPAPSRPTGANAPPCEGRGEVQDGSPRRILIVDDRPELAGLTQRLLNAWGHTVTVAHDGQQALHAAARQVPDVALVDIGLPGMSGYQLAALLRKRIDSILLVAVTGYAQPEHCRRIQEAGFDHHLVKPVDIDALREILSHAAC